MKKVKSKQYNVLILDDEQKYHDEVRKELENYAKEKGLKLNLIDTYNPGEALETYEKMVEQGKDFDLVVSDISMGKEFGHGHDIYMDKDGLKKFVKPLHDKYNKQKIIVMSSSKDFDIAIDAINAGAGYFVQKPHFEKLKEVMEKLEQKSHKT